MPLLLNTIFEQLGIPLAEVRLLRHQDGRSDRGKTPYALWRDDIAAFDRYQSVQAIANQGKLRASLWATFVVNPLHETLFAGLYRARHDGLTKEDRHWPHTTGFDPAGSVDAYELLYDERMREFHGKLVVDWGAGTRSWIQRADLQNKTIVALRSEFKEPEFPGFAHFIEPLSRIENLPSSWMEALKASKGVYLLTCPREEVQYVGSATSESGGFLGRWMDYVRTGHGGNVGLKMREPADYEVSILEVASSQASPEQILQLEEIWKKKLKSREMGLNRN